MKFIVYGNEDSPVVPILIYQPTKIAYVSSVELSVLFVFNRTKIIVEFCT